MKSWNMARSNGVTNTSDVNQVKLVIKIIADKLITIRDQHSTTELGLDECRSLENKIIKYYTRIVTMMNNAAPGVDTNEYMDFPLLLKVIGIDEEGIEEITHSETVRDVLMLDDSQTAVFTQKYSLRREETRKFCLFLHNLHRCVTDKKNNKEESLNNYVWQSWNKMARYHSTSSMDTLTLPGKMPRSQSYSLTNANLLNKVVNKSQPNLCSVVNMENATQYSSAPRGNKSDGGKKQRPSVLNLPCFMHPPSPALSSPIVMAHSIKHRFSSRSLLLSQNCDFCHKMMLFRYGVRCKECNYKCHKDCSLKAPASCGLPPQLEEFYKRQCENSQVPVQSTQTPSAITSSTPCSPGAHPTTNHINTPPLTPPASAPCSSKNKQQHFTFPEQCQGCANQPPSENPSSPVTGNLSPPASAAALLMETRPHDTSHSRGIKRGNQDHRTQHQDHRAQHQDHRAAQQEQQNKIQSHDNYRSSQHDSKHEPQRPLFDHRGPPQPNHRPLERAAPHYPGTLDRTGPHLPGTLERTAPHYPGSHYPQTPDLLHHDMSDDYQRHHRTLHDETPTPVPSHTKKAIAMATVNVTPSSTSPSIAMEDVTMTIKPVFDMDEDEEYDSDNSSEHEEEEEVDNMETHGGATLPTRKRFLRKSVLSDWGINYEELVIGKKIGDGRTGQVYEGKWHGDVVIKIYHIPHPTREQLAQFRREVQMLRKVRHENIVLFMGVCMNPPNLCIITEYLKGKSLHFYIHEQGKAFTERQSMLIMEQVSAALGYLHHRGIIHKNLKSKNIHLNDKKAVICDFGIGSMTDLKLKKGEKGFEVLFNVNLYYLAPEIIRKLQAIVAGKDKGEIELSEATDVYALGTVWYEILAGHWPWPGHSPEQVWWHLSKGLVPDVSSASPELGRLLHSCWSNDTQSRPNAAHLAKEIRSKPLPHALQRSPSHPVALKRTATS